VYTHTQTHTHTHTHTHTDDSTAPFILDPARLLRSLILELQLHAHELVRLAFDDVRISHKAPRGKDAAGTGEAGGVGVGGRVLVEFGFVASMLPALVSELACPQNQNDECMRISLLVNDSLVSEGTGEGKGGERGRP